VIKAREKQVKMKGRKTQARSGSVNIMISSLSSRA
jgi:hypothetical protein